MVHSWFQQILRIFFPQGFHFAASCLVRGRGRPCIHSSSSTPDAGSLWWLHPAFTNVCTRAPRLVAQGAEGAIVRLE